MLYLAPAENDGMEESDVDGENKEHPRNKVSKNMVELDQKRILAREHTVGPAINPTRILHFRSFPAASFPLCKYSRTSWCARTRTTVLFYFLPFIFLGNARLCRKRLSIIEFN